MKHFLIILSLLLAGSANCQEQDTALLADTATTLLSDQQLFELGKKDGLAKVGKGTSPFFSSEAYVNGWNEGTQLQSVGNAFNTCIIPVVLGVAGMIIGGVLLGIGLNSLLGFTHIGVGVGLLITGGISLISGLVCYDIRKHKHGTY